MQSDFMMSDFLQTEGLRLMNTIEIDLHTLRNILHMTLLLTHPTLMRECIQMRHQEWRKSQRLFLLRVF